MKNIFLSVLLVGMSTSALAVINQSGQTFLLVQTAGNAEVKAIPNQPNTYELTLTKASPYVTYFANRPTRVSGAMSSYKFSQRWPKAFSHDAPNADLVGVESSLMHHRYLNYTVELTKMQYDAKKQTFHYTVQVLPGSHKQLPKMLELHDAALFIDGVCLSCIG